jgi:uncharacterized protein YjiS (DUF1127 family)
MTLIKTILRTITQYRSFHATRNELSKLTDRDLKDIGISRGDIPRIALDLSERAVGAYRGEAGDDKRISGTFAGFAS